MDEQQTKRMALMVPVDLIKRMDRWRGAQSSIPSRSEAVRRLMDIALKTESAHVGA